MGYPIVRELQGMGLSPLKINTVQDRVGLFAAEGAVAFGKRH